MRVECYGVSRIYGRGRSARPAIEGVTWSADAGEVVGVIGPNGAGKTTLLNLIAGDVPLSTGELVVAGHRAGTRHARQCVGYAPDPPAAPPELSGIEWLAYLAAHRARSAAERGRLVREAVEVAELDGFAGRRVATYSRGMEQRLALGAAVVCARGVLLLDETLGGIDPLVQRRLRHQIERRAAAGVLVIISSHDLGAVERVATRVLVLAGGRVRADVSMAQLVRERVAELALTGGSLAAVERLLARYPAATRTGQGVAVPLTDGLSIEAVLAACREERLAVAASRVRYRALEDVLVSSSAPEEDRRIGPRQV